MKKKLVFKLMLLPVVGAMLLSACVAPTPQVIEKEVVVEKPVVETVVVEKEVVVEKVVTPAPPTEFVFAHPGPIYTMDAPVTWYGSTHWLTNLLYDCLIWRNPDLSGYHGQAAESWENIDDLTWRFHLRPGLTFHNGEPLDAHAVKWNIDRVRTREDFMVRPQWDFVKEVKVIDDLTLDIITPESIAYFERYVSYNGCELLPPKYIEEVGDEGFAKNPVGSGPYKLAKFIASERYEFEAWDDYWAGRPEVDRVVYQVIPEPASQVAALLAGQVDMLNNVPLPDREKVCGTEGIKCTKSSSDRGQFLLLRSELESGGVAEKYPGYDPPTLDKRIRHAISYALDRNLLAEVQASAYPTLVRVGRFYPEGYDDKYGGPEIVDEWYDPEKAKQLIIEAGYDPDAGDKPMIYFDAPNYWYGNEKEVAEVVTLMLEEVGFEVELNILDKSAYLELVHSPGLNRGLELAVKGVSPYLTPVFYKCDWWDLDYHVCIEEWDALNDQIISTIDFDERQGLWEQFWEYYLDWGGQIDLLEIEYTYAINEEFEWTPRADGWVTFRDLKVKR